MENIAPLAKILAEANGLDWKTIKGTGAGAQITEDDVLGHLALIMSGDIEPPSTPVDPEPSPAELAAATSPELLSRAGVDSDLTDLLKMQEDARAALKAQENTAVTADDFELDDEQDTEPSFGGVAAVGAGAAVGGLIAGMNAHSHEAQPAPEFNMSGMLSGVNNEPAHVEASHTEPVHTEAVHTEVEAASPYDAPHSPFDEPVEPVRTVYAAEPAEVVHTESVHTEPAAYEPEVHAPAASSWSQTATPAYQPPVYTETSHAQETQAQDSHTESEVAHTEVYAEPVHTEEVHAEPAYEADHAAQSEVVAPAAVALQAADAHLSASVPAVAAGEWKGVYLRRDADVTAAQEARTQLVEVLGELPLTVLVARAAQKSAASLGLSSVAIANTSGEALNADLSGDLRGSISGLNDAATGRQADLLVVDAGSLDLDDLHFPHAATLSVGRVENGKAALSLNGQVDPAQGARFLADVAALLTTPVKLLV